MTTSGREIGLPLRDALIRGIGEDRYQLWFEGKAAFSYRDKVLTCRATNAFYQDWLRANFRQAIEVATVSALGKGISVRFTVDDQLTEFDKDIAPLADRKVDTTPQPQAAEDRMTPSEPAATRVDAPQSEATRGTKRQRSYASIDDFVVGHANRVAQASVCMVAESPGCLTPLFLHGGTGVGKTHLLESVWNSALSRQPATRGLFLTAEQFTSLFLEALHHSGLPSFRRKYRNLEMLILDDIQFFGGKKATLGELLHTVETMLRHGRQIVLAADRPPSELEGFPAELMSRFSGGMVCKMLPPDLKMRKEIVSRSVVDRQWDLHEDIQALVAGRMSESPRELFGALNRLRATEIATGKQLTLSHAEEGARRSVSLSRPCDPPQGYREGGMRYVWPRTEKPSFDAKDQIDCPAPHAGDVARPQVHAARSCGDRRIFRESQSRDRHLRPEAGDQLGRSGRCGPVGGSSLPD